MGKNSAAACFWTGWIVSSGKTCARSRSKLRNGLCASGQSVAVIAGMDREGDQAVLTALLCGELARQGFSVLAVDMDAGHARLSGLLGVRPQACLSEYLAGGVSLLDVIVKTPERGLAFIEGLPPEGAVADIAATRGIPLLSQEREKPVRFCDFERRPGGVLCRRGHAGHAGGPNGAGRQRRRFYRRPSSTP